jgi:uncharacterized protein (DUF736 family)
MEEDTMPVIKTFFTVEDGYAGAVRAHAVATRILTCANRDSQWAHDFRIMAGTAEIRTTSRRPKQGPGASSLGGTSDDPTLRHCIRRAQLEAADDGVAWFLWSHDSKGVG